MKGESITPTIVIAELSAKYARLEQDFAPRLRFILSSSRSVVLLEETAELAGIRTGKKNKDAG